MGGQLSPVYCRNNLSYARYWEGRSQLQQMTGRLTEAVRTTLNFDRITLPDSKSPEEEAEEHRWFCDTLIHLVSLFHAVALATLRSDHDMENLTVRNPALCMHACYALQAEPGADCLHTSVAEMARRHRGHASRAALCLVLVGGRSGGGVSACLPCGVRVFEVRVYFCGGRCESH